MAGELQIYATQSLWRRQVTAWLRSTNLFNPLQYGAKGDNVTNDAATLQATLDAAVAAGGAMYLPPGYTFACGARLTINQTGNVAIFGEGTTSAIRFTATGSAAGFLFTQRTYNPATGVIDRVFLENFRIYAGAVHTSPAIQITYTSHFGSAETAVVVRNVQVTSEIGVFGTKQFSRGFSISNCYNFFVDTFTFVGSTTQNAVGIYINNSINGRFENCDISWCGDPIHITTGDGGVAQPQCEGLYFLNCVLYVNAGAFLVDGLSSFPDNAIDVVMEGGVIQPALAASPCLEWNLVNQGRIIGVLFYTPPGYPGNGLNLISCFGVTVALCDIVNVDGTTGTGTAGIMLSASFGASALLGNRLSGFDTGISFDATCSSNMFGQNATIDCTVPISDSGTDNMDFSNIVLGPGGAFIGVSGPGAAWTAYTPTVGHDGTLLTPVNSVAARYRQNPSLGLTYDIQCAITFGALGADVGVTYISVTLPNAINAAADFILVGQDAMGVMVRGWAQSGGNVVYIKLYNNTVMSYAGGTVFINGTVEAA